MAAVMPENALQQLGSGYPQGQVQLPALSESDAEGIEAATASQVRDLLGSRLAPNTLRTYATSLKYWATWHLAAYGKPLPLLEEPRQAVPPETVVAFIAQHCPGVPVDGAVSIGMPDLVRERIRLLGHSPTRSISKRAGVAGESRRDVVIDKDAVALSTLKVWVASLTAGHKLAGLGAQSPELMDFRVKQMLKVAGAQLAQRAPEALRLPKKPLEAGQLEQILERCREDGPRGKRDAAMLHAAFHSGGRRRSEVVQMSFDTLQGISLPEPVDGVQHGWRWDIERVKRRARTRADEPTMSVFLFGAAADALDDWLDWLRSRGVTTGAVWRALLVGKEEEVSPGEPLAEGAVADIVKARVSEIGLDPDQYAGHSLRSGAVTENLKADMALEDVAALVGHSNMATTRAYYDHRGARPELAAKMAGRARRKSGQ